MSQVGWPCRGPSATKEVLEGTAKGGLKPPTFPSPMASNLRGGAALWGCHRIWCAADYRSAVCLFQRTGGVAHLGRRVLVLERAMREDARLPDFEGSGRVPFARPRRQGGLEADLDKHVTEIQ